MYSGAYLTPPHLRAGLTPEDNFYGNDACFFMDLPQFLQPISILIEVVICVLCLFIAVKNKQKFGWFIALTFGIYVLYDLSAYTRTLLSAEVMALVFLVASLSMLSAVWMLFRGYEAECEGQP